MRNMHFVFDILLSCFMRVFSEGLNTLSLKGPDNISSKEEALRRIFCSL